MALAATDRALIRRVLAHLDSQGVLVRDESGWILHHPFGRKAHGRAGGGCVERIVQRRARLAQAGARADLPMSTVWSNGCAATWCRSGAPRGA